jgi:uncharacterized protein YggE
VTRGKKARGRAGGPPPARSITAGAEPVIEDSGPANAEETTSQKETKIMPSYGRTETVQAEGVTVIGEAVRAVLPERAEFYIEITATSQTAVQALRDNHAKTAQITQALAPLGVTQADIQPISQQVQSLYSPVVASLPPYGGALQIGPAGYPSYGTGSAVQAEVQFGSYQARHILRINVRETARLGEIADSAVRAGANAVGAFSFRPSDEALTRRTLLENAGRDAKSKAEALATVAGKQVGDLVNITEDIIASNGAYSALRTTAPFAFGSAAPDVAGELQYYARVTATFRLQ